MKTRFLVIPILLFFTSCLKPVVQTDKPQGPVNYAQYQTYAFLPTGDSTEFSQFNRQIVEQKTIDEISQEMRNRGFKLDSDNPDLLVLSHFMFQTKTEVVQRPVQTNYNYYRPGFYNGGYYNGYYRNYRAVPRVVGYNAQQVNYTEGTIAVDIIDRKTNNILWRGWSDDRVMPEDMSNSIRMYIDNIFEEFPVPAPGED